jgi:hypothetical protein
MLIQVDVDSTLYDADKLFGDLAEEAGIKWPRRDNGWKPAHELQKEDGSPCTPQDLKKVFRKAHSREYVAQNKPYPHSAKVIQGLVQDYPEIEIAYVSDRNEQQTGALKDWLYDNGFIEQDGYGTPHSEFHRDTYVAATKDKRHWMRERRPEIVIDDRVRTMLMARYELGSYVVSLQHNHNVNLKGEVEHIYIVKDWREIDKTLREIIIPKVQERSVTRTMELAYGR